MYEFDKKNQDNLFFFGEIENKYIIKRENLISVGRALAT
jgi:hypothetical protein